MPYLLPLFSLSLLSRLHAPRTLVSSEFVFFRYVAISFAVYDWTKRVFHHDEKGRVGHRLFFAALASLIAGSTTVPIDVVRRRLQLQGMETLF